MGLHFYVKFEGDATYTEITELVKFDSVKFSTSLCNDKFKFSQDTVKAQTIYDKATNDKFFSATKYLPCYVTYDLQDEQMYGYEAVSTYGYGDGDNYGFLSPGRIFTGAIYPNTKEVLRDYPTEGVSFEIVDNAYTIDKDCEAFSYPQLLSHTWKVFDPSDKTWSLIHQLLYKAGVDDSMISPIGSITKTVEHISKEEGDDTYLKIINDILYEHHHVAYFDRNGVFCIYDWAHEGIVIDDIITEADILDAGGVERKRNIIDYDGYKVIYKPLSTKAQGLVYREDIDEDGKLLLEGGYFPVDGAIKDIYQSFTNKYLSEDAKILNTFNHVLEVTKDDGIVIQSEFYESTQAKVLLKNNLTEDQRLFQLDIRADVVYEDGEEEFTVPSTAKKLDKDITFKYIFNESDAKEFANSLYNNIIKNGSYTYTFLSTNNYSIGRKYNVLTRDYDKNVLVIGKEWDDYTRAYKYNCIGVAQRVVQVGRIKSFRMSSTQAMIPPQPKMITLTGDTPTILYSSRGELKTNEVLFTVTPTNIDYADIVWTCNIGDEYLEDILDEFGNPIVNQKTIIAEDITEGPVVVTVYAIIDGVTYSASYSVAVVSEGLPKPMYLDARTDIPLVTEEGPLAKGDFFLYVGEYDGPNTEPVPPTDKTNPLYLNPTLTETNEFVYGRMYEYIGKDSIGTDLWEETRKSECFASAQKDALEIAKNSGVYLYVAVVVAQLGLFNDLLVANKLSSTNYDEYKEEDRETNPASPNYNKIIGLDGKEHEVGEPKKGFKLDGPEDIIKAYAMEAYNSKIFGTVESTGFKTLTGTEPVTISADSIPKTLWKYSDMFNYITDQETLYSVSGTIDGFTFDNATKRFNTRIKIASDSPYNRNFGAGDIATMGTIYPDFVFGRSIYVIARGKYDGNFSVRSMGYNSMQLVKTPSQPLQINVIGGLLKHLGKSFDYRTTLNMPANENLIKIQYGNNAWWGSVRGYLYELSAYTSKTFNGLVLRNGNNIKVIEPKPNAYYPNTKTWNIGANNQNTLSNYVSGTEFYNRFYELPSVVDGYVNDGKIKVKRIGQPLTEYTVTRLVKDGNGISFYTNLGIVRVDKFNEGTSSGVYEHLEITQDIEFKTVPDGIEVKSVLPWGTFVNDVENVTIGTVDARFESGYFKYLDILTNMLVRGTLNVTGVANVGYINTGGLGNFLIGQNLRTTDSPTFASINTGYGDNEVYKISNETIAFGNVTTNTGTVNKQISTMASGEIRFVRTTGRVYATSDTAYHARFYAPSGGTYWVIGGMPTAGSTSINVHGFVVGGGEIIWVVTRDKNTSTPLEHTMLIRRL